ncbi:hypothetical protein J1614_008898 [Plenodomus biglobosus]|nr:hypothetical protein J1614_008898 [Plenodomus biglobosus]
MVDNIRIGKEGAQSAQTAAESLSITPVLGDFKQAFFMVCADPDLVQDNPHDYLLNEEDTRYAPEHQGQYPNVPSIPLDTRTDVWERTSSYPKTPRSQLS